MGRGTKGGERLGRGTKGSERLGRGTKGGERLGRGTKGSERLGRGTKGSERLGRETKGSERLGRGTKGSERLGRGTKGGESLGEGPKGWSGGALREAIVSRVTGARTTLRLRTAFGPCHARVGVRGVKEEPRPSPVGARAPRRARDRAAPPARARPRHQCPPFLSNLGGPFSPSRSMPPFAPDPGRRTNRIRSSTEPANQERSLNHYPPQSQSQKPSSS